MSFNIEKLKQVALPVSEETKQEDAFRKENRSWLMRSMQIALAVRKELRRAGMTQQELADKMGVSPQYVGRILKGRENLTLETVAKMERALGKCFLAVQQDAPVMEIRAQVYWGVVDYASRDELQTFLSGPKRKTVSKIKERILS